MTRRRNVQQDLRPVYVRPELNRRETNANRDWCSAAYRGQRYRPKQGDFDPLWLRLGMRMNLIEQRAGWVVSNPLYDQVLRRNPRHDPSLPGDEWLRHVYHWYKARDLVTLPRVLRTIEGRIAALRGEVDSVIEPEATGPCGPAQGQLFGAEGT